jgi:RNA polymerase sigma-70 factor (ECF subfamily)
VYGLVQSADQVGRVTDEAPRQRREGRLRSGVRRFIFDDLRHAGVGPRGQDFVGTGRFQGDDFVAATAEPVERFDRQAEGLGRAWVGLPVRGGDFLVGDPDAQPVGAGKELDGRRVRTVRLAAAPSKNGPEMPGQRTRYLDHDGPAFHWLEDWPTGEERAADPASQAFAGRAQERPIVVARLGFGTGLASAAIGGTELRLRRVPDRLGRSEPRTTYKRGPEYCRVNGRAPTAKLMRLRAFGAGVNTAGTRLLPEKSRPLCLHSGAGGRLDCMGLLMDSNSAESVRLIRRARSGDAAALDELFARHRGRLRRMVEMRLDRRLQGRIDPSDVIQDAYVDATRKLDDYLRDPRLPLFLWLRLVVGERLMKLHRQHIGAQMRDAGREVSLYREALPTASSAALAAQLLGKYTSSTQAVVRAERLLRLQEALNALDPIDREILSLRHFEELTRAEAAQALGIEEAAAAKRYVRALKRLKDTLAGMPGGLAGL